MMIKFKNKKSNNINNKFKKIVSDYEHLKLEIETVKQQINLLYNVYPTYTDDLDFEEMLIG